MKLTRIKRGPRSMGMELLIDNVTGKARYIVYMGDKNHTNEFHTTEGENLPM